MTQSQDSIFLAMMAIDKPNAYELRSKNRDDHLAHVAEHRALIQYSGPLLNGEGQMIGSLIIFVNKPSEVQNFINNDPYTKAGLFQSTQVLPWKLLIKS